MRNPLRDEATAFHVVIGTIGFSALVALASWINAWIGLGLFVALSAVAVLALRGGERGQPQQVAVRRETGAHHILVVANETLAGEALRELIAARGRRTSKDVLVVCPALNSRVRTWTSDEDDARQAAQARVDSLVRSLREIGLAARGTIGDGDPVQAIEDALRTFPADEIVVSTHRPGQSNWLERGVIERTRQRVSIPVTHVIGARVEPPPMDGAPAFVT
jgi:predicted nucleic acid-binding protein